MFETRVNLKHLLEDIRDSYTLPLEEVIVVELVANALDSKAQNISFYIDALEHSLTVVDDGRGMKRNDLRDYHNIAATTKQKGQGIGFAGVGAKLSLLLANSVLTETKGGYGSRAATLWHLSSNTRAPWKFVPFSGKVKTTRGTAVCITLSSGASPLLSTDFLETTIQKHFLPLFIAEVHQKIFRYIYPKGIAFFVEGNRVVLPEVFKRELQSKNFALRLKTQRSVAGFGCLLRIPEGLPEELRGVAISTYGKIIKRGWEWLGLDVKSSSIAGVIEIPALAQILTTNKTDFLQDATSLKKYYRYRKAIQQALLPVLVELGAPVPLAERQKSFRALSKEIEKALHYLLRNFPEITPLFGFKTSAAGRRISQSQTPLVDFMPAGVSESERQEKELYPLDENGALRKKDRTKRETQKRTPKISIGFEENENQALLGRMLENTIWLNKNHAAYLKALSEGLEDYHILLTVAWVLAGFIEKERSPLEFISQFFASWAKEKQVTLFAVKRKT